MLTCREIAELATDRLEGQLSFAQRLRVRLHLVMCRHCRAYTDQIRQTIQALRQLPRAPVSPDAREARLGRFRAWTQQPAATSRPGRTDHDML